MEISAIKLGKIGVFIIGGKLCIKQCITEGLVLGLIEAALFDALFSKL